MNDLKPIKDVASVMDRFNVPVIESRCDRHGIKFEIFEHPITGNYEACPKCEAEKVEREKSEAIRYRNARCNIEPMYHNATLANFEADTEELEIARSAVYKLIQSRTGKLVMMGANGTGKTHLAVAAVRELKGKILTMYEITTRIRASYVSGAKESEIQIVDELANLPMLAIDEIGRTKGSDSETNWLSYIIDKRHVRGLPLILITNKHRRKDCPSKNGCGECLENYIGNDIMSRLNEDGLVIKFTGDDWRKKKRSMR